MPLTLSRRLFCEAAAAWTAVPDGGEKEAKTANGAKYATSRLQFCICAVEAFGLLQIIANFT